MKNSLKQKLIVIVVSGLIILFGQMQGSAPADQVASAANQQEQMIPQEIPAPMQEQPDKANDEGEEKGSVSSVFNEARVGVFSGIQQGIKKAKQMTLASVGSSIAAVRYVAKSGARALGKSNKPVQNIQEEIEVDIDQLTAERDEFLDEGGVYGYLYFKLISFVGHADDESEFEQELQQDVLKSAPGYIDSIVKGLQNKWSNIVQNGIYVEQDDSLEEAGVSVSYICSREQYVQIAENINHDYDRIKLKLNELGNKE